MIEFLNLMEADHSIGLVVKSLSIMKQEIKKETNLLDKLKQQ